MTEPTQPIPTPFQRMSEANQGAVEEYKNTLVQIRQAEEVIRAQQVQMDFMLEKRAKIEDQLNLWAVLGQVINEDETTRQEQIHLAQEKKAAGDKVVEFPGPADPQDQSDPYAGIAPRIEGQPGEQLAVETEGETTITSEPVEELTPELVEEPTPELEGSEQPE